MPHTITYKGEESEFTVNYDSLELAAAAAVAGIRSGGFKAIDHEYD